MDNNKLEEVVKEIKAKEIFDCPGFCHYSNKCDLSGDRCIYEKKGEDKEYCTFYNFYLLSEGRYGF